MTAPNLRRAWDDFLEQAQDIQTRIWATVTLAAATVIMASVYESRDLMEKALVSLLIGLVAAIIYGLACLLWHIIRAPYRRAEELANEIESSGIRDTRAELQKHRDALKKGEVMVVLRIKGPPVINGQRGCCLLPENLNPAYDLECMTSRELVDQFTQCKERLARAEEALSGL